MSENLAVPLDLSAEPGKWAPCAILALVAVLLLGGPSFVSFVDAKPRAAVLRVHKVSLLPPGQIAPAPVSEPSPQPEPPPPEKPPTQNPNAAEIALKEVQASIIAERQRRETEEEKKRERQQREEDDKRRKAEEDDKRKKKQEDEKKKRRAREKREQEEKEREEKEADKNRREAAEKAAAEARARADKERIKAAEVRAAKLRAEGKARARAAEDARLADLRGVYISRIIAQIENQLATPASVVGRDDVVVEVRVLLHPDGELNGWPTVTRPSGFPDYDEEAIRAVIKAAPLVVPTGEAELIQEFLRLDLHIRPE